MGKKRQYTVLGVSSGLGVSLFPFKDELIGNIESRGIFHTAQDEQWKSNFPDVPLWKNSKVKYSNADIIISSPDCGSGSIFRLSRAKVYGNHENNDSLDLFFTKVEETNCKFFLFENLEGLFKSFAKEKFIEILKNYRLIIHNESVAKWGNSQINRKRLIIVGIRKDLPKKLEKYFKLPHYEDKIMNCGDLYGDLGATDIPFGHVRENIHDVISIHARRRMALMEIQSEWLKRLKGKKRWDVIGGSFSTAPGVYRNLSNDFPATARKANRQFDHNGLTLTPRQLARVQGVPDSFKIFIDPNKIGYWINKGRTAVTKTPPYEISLWFKKKIDKIYGKENLREEILSRS